VKRLIGILLLLAMASLACFLSPNPLYAQPDFPTASGLATPTLDQNSILPSAVPQSTAVNTQNPVVEPTLANTQSPTAAPALTADQLRNATLTFVGSDQMLRTIAFKNGQSQEQGDPQTGSVLVSMDEKIAFGDLNADGLQDAAIVINEDFGGSGVFVSVVAILNDNGQPNPVATAVIDDRARLNTLEIVNGEILVDATVHGPGDPMCCASQPTKRVYRLIENDLTLSRLSTKTSDGVERVIQIDAPVNGVELSGPFMIKGTVSVSPFENNLVYRVFQPGSKDPIEQAGFIISADGLGGPGSFELTLDFSQKGFKGPLHIEIVDISPADGSTLALASIDVILK
jgi:hypothetical protein